MCRGSEWRKWDLHIHTPASFHNEFQFSGEKDRESYQNSTWGKYIDELEKISDVAVIGIADYFTLEGYRKVLEYSLGGRLKNFKLILPNIEFRLDKFVEDKRLNYHVIFSDEITPDTIEKEFLEELHIKAPNAEPRKLSRVNIEEIGKILKEQNDNFRDRTDFIVGCQNITVSLDEIVRILKSKMSIFCGKHLLVLEEEGWDSITWSGQDHLTRQGLLVQSHAIFSSNANTKDWALGKRHEKVEDFIKEFGSLKPCIHGSDAHSYQRLCKPDQDRFCWIKADPSFEGLKQIVYEPEDRVKVQSENPEYQKNIYTLSSIKIKNSFINPELSIAEQNVALSRNLVAITGGKGSGKTALLDLIANCFEDRCERAGVDRNSFVQRIEGEKQDLETEIAFIGEELGGFSKRLTQAEFFKQSKITYLPQGEIVEYSGDRQRLDKKIQEIIFSNKVVVDKRYRQQFDRLRAEIDELAEGIDEINVEIYELEEETKKEIIYETESLKGIKEGELKNKQEELRIHTEQMEAGIKDSISKLKEEETKLQVQHFKLGDVKAKSEELRNDLLESLYIFNEAIDNLNLALSGLVDDFALPQLDFSPQFDAIQRVLEAISQKTVDVMTQIEEKNKQLGQLSGAEKAQAELLKDIEIIVADLGSLQKQMEEFNEKKEKIKILENRRLDKYQVLLTKYWEWKKYYEEVITAFSTGRGKIMQGIDFLSSIYFDKKRFLEVGVDLVDQRKITEDEIKDDADKLEALINQASVENLQHGVSEFFEAISSRRTLLKTTRNSLDFSKWVFDNYFSLSTKILFRGIPIDKLSIGQKGTILLKLFLAEGDYPLIIDQPEESLDNKFIFDELVGAFRDAKKNRQVIIATNNANLVVNTDAEQIIVAEYESNCISYKSGSLENLKIRAEIMPILEGGKEAFKKREEKYGI